MDVDVLIAAPHTDPHALAVKHHLGRLGAETICSPLAEVPRWGISWSGEDSLWVRGSNGRRRIGSYTSVWWRRPHAGLIALADERERHLAEDEIAALIPGILESIGVRWVDAPWDLLRARQKAVQLHAAFACNARTPYFSICGDEAEGRRFANGRSVVAKAVSSGYGLAPFVAEVPEVALFRLEACPTMLQERVAATVDVRLVTVGYSTLAWSRPRSPEVVDWRLADPQGVDFRFLEDDPTEGTASAIANRLKLGMSIQDWVVDAEGTPIFLEANPQGQWLFLDQAEDIVAPKVAAFLLGDNR